MGQTIQLDNSAGRQAVYPLGFSVESEAAAKVYLGDPATARLAEFFRKKGLAALKEEDRNEQWYEDWLEYQARHRLYAMVLSPKKYSTLGFEFDLLRLTRFLEVFGYFSPAHGYSLQVSFLGLHSILMGTNDELKREAVGALEAGGLLAFGVSEKNHGSDLLGNQFTVEPISPGRFVANGSKYYIGNANTASIIAVLGGMKSGRGKRMPPVLFVLRPRQSRGFGKAKKIRTLGIRAGFVGEFEVTQHELPQGDLVAQGRSAWDAVLGTVTLGKFFLGFGSIGICEHALEEALDHLSGRVLFGKPVIEMPHIAAAAAAAYARLTAMKLYGYRAVDYVHIACETDRRYLLFAAVQKAKVSTEGVKVLALLSECLGAKGFEADTYFEMALRDAQLIPALEGSTHINLGQAVQFAKQYFRRGAAQPAAVPSLVLAQAQPGENPYLVQARTGAVETVGFGRFLNAYLPLKSVPNVRVFAKQATALALFVRGRRGRPDVAADPALALVLGHCLATVVYGQLIAENSVLLEVPAKIVAAVFHLLVHDLSISALTLASSPRLDAASRHLIRRLVQVPQTTEAEWSFVLARVRQGHAGHATGS
jgi:acyl-CoA dehydrogenase